jgi:hypothetical protein
VGAVAEDEQMDEYAPPRLGRQLLLLVALFLVIGLIVAGVVAAPIIAVNTKLNEPGEYGVCNPFSTRCHDVPLETISAVTRVDFPEGAKVLTSEAVEHSMLGMGIEYVEGAVEVPDGWAIEQLPDSPGNSTMVEQELLDLGADSIVVSSERTGYLQYGQGQVDGRNVVAVWTRTNR